MEGVLKEKRPGKRKTLRRTPVREAKWEKKTPMMTLR